MDTTAPIVLYVYHCEVCGHVGQLHLTESAPEVTTACALCGAEVQAEWDGGVELTTNEPEYLSRFAPHGESLDSALARIERLRTCAREVWPCFSCLMEARDESGGLRWPVNFVENGNQCDGCQHLEEVFDMHEQEHDDNEEARYAAMSLFDGPHPYGFALVLDGRHLYTYGDGVHGWGPVSSTTGAIGELVRWATADEAEAWARDRAVFSAGAVVEGICPV